MGQQGALQTSDGGSNVTAPEQALFSYLQSHAPPPYYGYVYTLPEGLRFLFKTTDSTEGKMIVRDCYERVIAIVDRGLASKKNGVVFSGAQGNSKSWCSMFVVWHLLCKGKCVVYEVAALDVCYVIRPSGVVSVIAGRANKATVRELGDRNTIHVYDAKASANREPAESNAFLVEFSSCNERSYAQTLRQPGMLHCCIPSYDLEELLDVCEMFGVAADEVRRRCKEIGPSIRYILINDYATSKERTFRMASTVKPDQLERYISDSSAVTGTADDISACLLKVLVDESRFSDPLDAYLEFNVEWQFASQELCKTCLSQAENLAKQFVRNFIITVDRGGITKLKGVAGNVLELIVDKFLLAGSFQSARRLTDDARASTSFTELRLWQKGAIALQAGEATTVEEALRMCTNAAVLYSSCKTFTAVDFTAQDLRVLFQVTVSPSHPVQLEAIRTFCRYVKEKYPRNPTVLLVFVVPEGTVSAEATGNWRWTQSFQYVIEEVIARGGSAAGGGVVTRRKKTHKWDKLPEDAKADLEHLQQWVVCYKE